MLNVNSANLYMCYDSKPLQGGRAEINQTAVAYNTEPGTRLYAGNLVGATAVGGCLISQQGEVTLALSKWSTGLDCDTRRDGTFESVRLIQAIGERAQRPDIFAAGLLIATFDLAKNPGEVSIHYNNQPIVRSVEAATTELMSNQKVSIAPIEYPQPNKGGPYSVGVIHESDSVRLTMQQGDFNPQSASQGLNIPLPR